MKNFFDRIKEKMNSKKNKKYIIILIIISLLLIIGSSFAWWNYEYLGTQSQIEAHSIEIEYLESNTGIINIEDAFPMIDDVGIKQEESFDFQVKTKTKKDSSIKYNIVIERLGIKCSDVTSPSFENYSSCYDYNLTTAEKEQIAEFILANDTWYGTTETEVLIFLEANIAHDKQGIYDAMINVGHTEEESKLTADEFEYLGYETYIASIYESATGTTISSGKTFNPENRAYSNFLYDDEVKIYLTDYEGNVLVEPTLMSEIANNGYVLYTDINKHGLDKKEIIDKYKVKVWIDENVDPSNWPEDAKLFFNFKININGESNETPDFSGANKPVLTANMIPVYYDETCNNNAGCWEKADKENRKYQYQWYDYDNKMWANSVTVTEDSRATYASADLGTEIKMDDILTMQVWIPRYTYTVWHYNSTGLAKGSPQEIQIKFEKGTTSSGEIQCVDNIQGTSDGTASGTMPTSSETCKIKSTNETCTNSKCNGKTYTHPAFTFGDKELEGFWVGKFELSSDIECTPADSSNVNSGCNLTSIKPTIKPNAVSWRGAMISVYANNIMAMNDNGNKYGFTNQNDTHMIKNMEWGAIGYLAYSKYGTNKELAINSNNSLLTGCGPQSEGDENSGDICNSYDTTLGQSASTTGNIYGVYDMRGGSHDVTMVNMAGLDGTTMMVGKNSTENSGYKGILYDNGNYTNYDGIYTYPENKYYDKYSFGTEYAQRNRGKLGEGIREVFVATGRGWYSNYCFFHSAVRGVYFIRGGYYNGGNNGGVVSSYYTNGDASTIVSTRLVIS